ncbi:LPS assembly lipoprotein LptE [Glaciecola sp. 1036]|uniref:LPS-assembly lipoprotein LptE n=1 Tax=Alteromonadaceae TaxID=72275 RepID=UPI003D009AC6
MTSLKAILIVVISLSLSACGFTLRGSQALPEQLTTVIIKSPLQYAPISRTLSERLPVYQLNGYSMEQAMTMSFVQGSLVQITLQPEQLERRLLSMFSNGQVAEYELLYTIDYQVQFPDKQIINHSVTVAREYQEDPNRILAKTRELEEVMQEMRNETADRMIRLLSSQYATSLPAEE